MEVSKGPDLARMSAAQRTTFNYYVGRLAFEEEDYVKVGVVDRARLADGASR